MQKCYLAEILLYKEGGLTQKQLANASNISQNTISKLVNGVEISERSRVLILNGLNNLSKNEYSMKDLFTPVDKKG